MDALKIFLNSAAGQHIRQVYLNNKMEWLFAPRPGYEKIISREDVLAYEVAPSKAAEKANKAELSNIVQRKKALSSPIQKHSNRF